MDSAKLALLRLAAREFEGVSAACEMFLGHGIHHHSADDEVWALLKQAEIIQKKADKIRDKLDRKLAPFAFVDVKEIY